MRRLLIWTKVAGSWEHQSINISGEGMTNVERTNINGSFGITTLGRKEYKESDAQGVLVPQWHNNAPDYILTLDNKWNMECMILLSTTIYETSKMLQRTWATSVERHQSRHLCWSNFSEVTRLRLTQVVEVVMLPQDQRPSYICHHYSVLLCRKGKWRTLTSKSIAKGG